MGIVLGPNQYGKAEVRVVAVDRSSPRHTLVDLNVSSSLRGDFSAAHTAGDNGHVLATDTQKNTVFAFAKEKGVAAPEDFGLELADHFLRAAPRADGARIELEETTWSRIPVGGEEHDHAFVQAGGGVRTAVVNVDGRGADRRAHVVAGIHDLVVLKSTGSEFRGFLTDRYTTLQPTSDRIMATALVARWRYNVAEGVDWDRTFDGVRAALLEQFATVHSHALQQTLYAMGKAVLEQFSQIDEIRFSAPNKHHFPVDLAPFGVPNPNEVFYAADRPYGLIEATVLRDDATDPGSAWHAVPSFV